jgi:hypothetical protein
MACSIDRVTQAAFPPAHRLLSLVQKHNRERVKRCGDPSVPFVAMGGSRLIISLLRYPSSGHHPAIIRA